MDIKEAISEKSIILIISTILYFLIPTLSIAVESSIDLNNAEHYKLNTGDTIRIQVYEENDLNQETKIDDSGVISFPFIGQLRIKGKTPAEIESEITNKLIGDYLIHPKVSVDIVEYRPFYVNGEVQSPGGFPYQPGITVRKAISIAGGFKERASKEKIYIIREDSLDGEPVKISLDSKVKPGDIITVEQSFF